MAAWALAACSLATRAHAACSLAARALAAWVLAACSLAARALAGWVLAACMAQQVLLKHTFMKVKKKTGDAWLDDRGDSGTG